MKTITLFSYDTKIYLDEMPALHRTLKDYLTELHLDTWGSGSENWLHELECRSRDGFMAAKHNCGGFDVYNTYDSYIDDEYPEDSVIVFHGFRVMYEGVEDGVHTMCVYYCQWDEHDYSGLHGADPISKLEIRFKTSSGLMRQLKAFINKTLKA